jgi:Flp pilus assembly pilin Flp
MLSGAEQGGRVRGEVVRLSKVWQVRVAQPGCVGVSLFTSASSKKGIKGNPHKGGTTMIDLMKKFIRDEQGQDLVEYALLLVFLALAAIAILPTLGSSINKVFSQSNSALNPS